MAPERTALAWQRTALSVVVAASVVAKVHLTEDHVLPLVGTAASLLLGLAVLAEAFLRERRRAARRPCRARGGRVSALLALAVLAVLASELVAMLQG